jgi:pimeloyl-ACP methyl ester carboxylesterase
MRGIILATLVAFAGLIPAVGAAAADPSTAFGPVRSGYAPVNGLQMYFEIYGKGAGGAAAGEPLVLLHGGIASIEMYSAILPALAANRQVIAADLQAHGRTADIDRPLSYEAMADDVAGLVRSLGHANADLMGYSLGGEVALQVAIRHPEVVRKLVLVSTAFRQDGWYPEVLAAEAQMGPAAAEQMKQTPLYQLYASIAPRPQDWPVLVTKTGDLLRKGYDWSAGVAALKMPVLIVGADADAVRTAHTLEFFGMLGGGKRDAGWDGSGRPSAQLAILPGTSHYTIFMSPALPAAVTPFLDAPLPQTK